MIDQKKGWWVQKRYDESGEEMVNQEKE